MVVVLIVSLLLALVGPTLWIRASQATPFQRSSAAQAAVRALPLGEGERRPELHVGLGEAWTLVGSGLSRPHRPQFTTENKIQGRGRSRKLHDSRSLLYNGRVRSGGERGER